MRDRALAVLLACAALVSCAVKPQQSAHDAPSIAAMDATPSSTATAAIIPRHDLDMTAANAVMAVTPPSAKPAIPMAQIKQAVEDAFKQGIRWALANQRRDGNWGSFESIREREIYLDTAASHRAFQSATTAIVAWSMIEPARTDDRCRAALESALKQLSQQGAPGRASGKTFYSVWTHNFLIQLAAEVQSDSSLAQHHAAWKKIAAREIAIVRREQGAEGGWGYYDFEFTGLQPSGNESTSFNTASMVISMLAAQKQGAIIPLGTFQDATKAILRMQLPSGAFAYGTYAQLNPRADYNKVSGSSGRLQPCNVALYMVNAGNVTQATLLRGVQHLRDTHQYIAIARGRVMPHESFYRNSGYYYYYDHYYAALALAHAAPSPERSELVRWLTQVMVHDQNPDGSWFDYPLYGYGKAYATGFGLLTLEVLRPLIDQIDAK